MSAEPELTLEQFFQHVSLTNPFVIDRVVHAAQATEWDAEEVHQAQFRRLLRLARTVSEQHSGIGVLLWGEAGVGKSHLLSRLARWSHTNEQACFVYLLNLQPGPENLPRTLLRVTVNHLTKGRQDRFHETPLFRLVQSAVQTALQENDPTLKPEEAYARLLDRLSAQAPAQPAFVDRTIYNVLFRFMGSALRARPGQDDGVAGIAVRWLGGDPLDVAEARALGLPHQPARDDTVALLDDQQIKLVLVALSQMALFANQPLLLCFDQVETASPEQMQAQARFLQGLLDSSPNLLVVTCGVNDTLLKWHREGVIPQASWDRIAQFEIDLPRVTPGEARQIMEARLNPFLTPFMELDAVKARVQEDRLFPLGEASFDEFLKDKIELRPRHVIKWARDVWTNIQEAIEEKRGTEWLNGAGNKPAVLKRSVIEPMEKLIDRKIDVKMDEQKRQRQIDPETLPPDADNMAGLVHSLLRQCVNQSRPYPLMDVQPVHAPNKRQRPAYHLAVHQNKDKKDESVGVLFLTPGKSSSAATFALKRAVEDRRPSVVLVTDKRRPLQLGPKGRQYLDELRRGYGERFTQVELSFDEYAFLDALKATAGMGLSRDLEVDLPDGEIYHVPEKDVIASHHRCNRYASHRLLARLLGVADPAPVLAPDAAPERKPTMDESSDVCQFIMAQLALMPGASSQELTVKFIEYLKITKRPALDGAACKVLLEGAARDLHQKGHVNATPIEGGLFLLPRRS